MDALARFKNVFRAAQVWDERNLLLVTFKHYSKVFSFVYYNSKMVKNIRITYRRRCAYRTKSNKMRPVKTPGGKLVGAFVSKRANGPKCGDCGTRLPGIPALRPKEYRSVPKRMRTVSRTYGGSRCANCVKARIVRAFLIEEQKIVKKVLQSKKDKKSEKKSKESKKSSK